MSAALATLNFVISGFPKRDWVRLSLASSGLAGCHAKMATYYVQYIPSIRPFKRSPLLMFCVLYRVPHSPVDQDGQYLLSMNHCPNPIPIRLPTPILYGLNAV